MPVRVHQNSKSGRAYCQWGNGKKYFFTPGNTISYLSALSKARAQGRAAFANGYTGK